jgi:hypothetical protein
MTQSEPDQKCPRAVEGILVQVLATCFCLGTILAGCDDRIRVTYPDWAAAERDGAFRRGWLPSWMPNFAHDIEEIHDLDTNAQAMSFVVPSGWRPPASAECSPAKTAIQAPRLRLSSFPTRIEKRPDVLKCKDLFVIVDGKIAFAWR